VTNQRYKAIGCLRGKKRNCGFKRLYHFAPVTTFAGRRKDEVIGRGVERKGLPASFKKERERRGFPPQI